MNLAALYIDGKKRWYRLRFGKDAKPEINLWFINGISVNSQHIAQGAAGWRALDATYNHYRGEGRTVFIRAVDWWWLHIRNAQAVRNRLKIAKRELHAAVDATARARPHQPVRILSLAAGTAQGVIEVIAECRLRGIAVEALLIDLDESALENALTIAREHGVEEKIVMRKGNVLRFMLDGYEPDIIEMMGLTDYLVDHLAVALFKRILRHMKPGGFFLTCHIHPNSESYFLRQAVNWDMLYRSVEELRNLVIAGGFTEPRIITEPLKIHSVAVVRKSAT